MTTLAQIASRDWSMKLGVLGEAVEALDDIAQCLRVIVTTQKGTDPLRPDFACDLFGFIDLPITTMVPHAVREITAAIQRYEPRVVLLAVLVTPLTDQQGGHVDIEIRWRLNIAGTASVARSTLVTIPRAVA